MRILLVLGTRPQIIKSASIVHLASNCSDIDLEVVHTGQHYDYEMSRVFFDEMTLPDPLANLGVGSGSHAWQTGQMLMRIEEILLDHKPDLVLVPGDTNSTLAGSLAAAKSCVPIGHIEAGARSYDMGMPEEVNRRLTDHCSDLLFATTEKCVRNLEEEGIPSERVFPTGDTMYDVLLQHMDKASRSRILKEFGLTRREYALLTAHRQENVDDPGRLANIAEAALRLDEIKIVFCVHPRTEKRLRSRDLYRKLQSQKHIQIIKPVGYNDMISLIKSARLVLTDSGGMQKEAFWLHVPCITLRENTEWVETVDLGANVLAGCRYGKILQIAAGVLKSDDVHESLRYLPNPFGDGNASSRIINAIRESRKG